MTPPVPLYSAHASPYTPDVPLPSGPDKNTAPGSARYGARGCVQLF